MQGAASRIDASLPVFQCFHGGAGRCEIGGERHVARDRYRAGIVGIAIVPSHEIVLPERYGDKGRRASLRILTTTYHISHRFVCGVGRNRVQGYAGLPIVTLSIWVQPLNAPSSIVVTELPIVTVFKPVQPSNALLPIFVTELGMETSVKPVQL